MIAPWRNVLVLMFSASFASAIGGLPFNTLPVILGSLADSLSLDPQGMGLLGSLCTGGYLLGALSAPLWVDPINWKVITAAAAVGVAVVLSISANATGAVLKTALAAFGFCAALMHCLGNRMIAELPDKERGFGMRLFVELVFIAGVLAILPFAIARAGYSGAAFTLAISATVLGLAALFVPARGAPATAAAALHERTGWLGWIALAIFTLYAVGQVALWVFLDRMAKRIDAQPAEVATLFSMLKFVGGGSAAFVTLLGARLGDRLPHVLAFVILASGIALMAVAGSFWPMAFGAWIWEAGFTIGCVHQTAAMAKVDPSNRLVVLVPAAFAISSFIGPALGGWLTQDGSFTPLLVTALVCAMIPAVAYQHFMRKIPARLEAAPTSR